MGLVSLFNGNQIGHDPNQLHIIKIGLKTQAQHVLRRYLGMRGDTRDASEFRLVFVPGALRSVT